MKHLNFIALISIVAGASVWAGCSSSTTTTPPAGSLAAPASVNFGNTRLGVCADTLLGVPLDMNLSLENTGSDTLRIHSAASPAAQFTVFPFDSAIAPMAYDTMRLQFCPSLPGSASATLVIGSNAPQDTSLTITLTGIGVPYSPGIGSKYTYSAENLTDSGTVTGLPFVTTDSIIATGLNYEGQANASENSDSTYYIIQNSGDASLYVLGFPMYPATDIAGSGWQTLPFMSHGQNIQLLSDDQTYTDSLNESVTLSIRDSASYIGTTTTTIDNIQVQESHVHLVESGLYTSTKGTILARIVLEIYFSPDLGTIVSQSRVEREVVTATGGKPKVSGGGRKIDLMSFRSY